MKKSVLILTSLILFSCKEPLVSFSEAQHENSKDLNFFPKKLIGKYYNIAENCELEIREKLIIKISTLTDTFHINELPKSEILRKDSIINTLTSEKNVVTPINDSLFTNYIYKDTLFHINDNSILRKMKGYYFLNSKMSDANWYVQKLFLKNGQLCINTITSQDEITLLETLTESKKDTVKPFVVKPTKKQFKEFVKKNGFSEGEVYLRK